MKILVFDDKQVNRDAAVAQLKDHDLTVVGTYDDAQRLLTVHQDSGKRFAILRNQFGDFDPYRSDDEEKKAKYFAAEKVAKEQTTTYPDVDVVLADLLVPASDQAQGDSRYVGQEMPIGVFIGLLAAVKARARYVAVFTDSNHHEHPASACFNRFNAGETNPTPFRVEDSQVLLSNTRNWVSQFDPSNLCVALGWEESDKRSDTVRAKNWAALLEYLLKSDESATARAADKEVPACTH